MIRRVKIVLIIIFISLTTFGQKLELNEILNLYTYSIEKTCDYMTGKGWDLFISNNEMITFAYNSDGDYANAFLTIFNYNLDSKNIGYQTHDKDVYLAIKNSLSFHGFKYTSTDVALNKISNFYKKGDYILEITSNPDEHGTTSYKIYLYK